MTTRQRALLEAGVAGGSATALYQIAGPLLFLLPVSVVGMVRERRVALAGAGIALGLIAAVRGAQLAFGSGPANWQLLGVDVLVLGVLAVMSYVLVEQFPLPVTGPADMHTRVLVSLGLGVLALGFPVGWILGSAEFAALIGALYSQLSDLSAQASTTMPWGDVESFRADIVAGTWQTYGISAGLLVGVNHLLARPLARRLGGGEVPFALRPTALRLPMTWLYTMLGGLVVMLLGRLWGVQPLAGLGWTYLLAAVFAYGLLGAGLGLDWLRYLQERQLRLINGVPALLFLLLIFRPTRLLLASGMLVAGLADQWISIRPQRRNGARNNESNPDE